jgi:hypothetical protein
MAEIKCESNTKQAIADVLVSAANDGSGNDSHCSSGGHVFHFHGAVTINITNNHGGTEFDEDYHDEDELDGVVTTDDEEEEEPLPNLPDKKTKKKKKCDK